MDFHKLDNIGTFYASTSSKPNPDTFRFSVTLEDNIDKDKLVKALKIAKSAYPSFNSSLRMGFFWYYLEEEEEIPEVREEDLPVCARLDTYADDVLYRVSYYKNRINLEVSHILSDGRGTLEFFTYLVDTYCSLKYKIDDIDLVTKASVAEKDEDSFDKYYKKSPMPNKKMEKIYNLTGKKIKKHKIRFIEMHTNTHDVIKISKEKNVTMTVLLTSILIRAIMRTMKYKDKGSVIRIAVPVDLRGYYYSKTTKNFFGIVHVSYKFNGEVADIDDIIKKVYEELTDSLKEENISKRSNQMYAIVDNLVVRSIPLIIKNIGLRIIDEGTSKSVTTNFSNMGKISFDKRAEEHIKGIALLTSTDDLQFVISSFKDDLCISASSVYNRNNVLTYFVQELKSYGLDINVITNGV